MIPSGVLTTAKGSILYHSILRDLLAAGKLVPGAKTQGSPGFARASVELTGYQFRLTNPRSRWINSTSRPLNIPFCFGLCMYFLRGTDDVESIEYYNPLASKFTDDGKTIPGSSYGARAHPNTIIDILRKDPTSRRAVMPIFSTFDYRESKDIPCPVAVQFLVRDGRLHCFSFFRSQNALTVFPYDLFLFTWLHEYFALRLGYEPGDYTQMTGSMHVYDDELRHLGSEVGEPLKGPFEMAPMEAFEQQRFLAIEETIRQYGLKTVNLADLPPLYDLKPYWQSVYGLLLAFANARRNGERHLRNLEIIKTIAPHLFIKNE